MSFVPLLLCSFNRTIDGENPGRDIRLQGEFFVMVGTSINQLTSSSQPKLPTHKHTHPWRTERERGTLKLIIASSHLLLSFNKNNNNDDDHNNNEETYHILCCAETHSYPSCLISFQVEGKMTLCFTTPKNLTECSQFPVPCVQPEGWLTSKIT